MPSDPFAPPQINSEMPPPLPRLTLIVATTPALGIGHAGTLPWPLLKADLRFFARVTKRPPPLPLPNHNRASVSAEPNKANSNEQNSQAVGEVGKKVKVMNAVIMGRKTWDSLPESARPLPGRINVVLSRSTHIYFEGPTNAAEEQRESDKHTPPPTPLILHAPDLLYALDLLRFNFAPDRPQPQFSEPSIVLGRTFVIGGAQIYAAALEVKDSDGKPLADRILWTRLNRNWECDVWFPSGVIVLPTAKKEGAEEGLGESSNLRPGNGWAVRSREDMEKWVGEEGVGGVKREGDVEFEVVMVERDGVV